MERAAPSNSPEQPVAQAATQLAAPEELLERLDRIERKLSDLGRHEVASEECFRAWLREGYWAHIRFGEFLRLRRAGVL